VTVHHVGAPIPSMPHIEMTIAMLDEQGIQVRRDGSTVWHVDPQNVPALDRHIEPDLSNAAPFLAAALVTAGTVTIPDWPQRTVQAGDALRDLLSRMGAEVVLDSSGLTVRGTGVVHGLEADLADVGELAPALAAVAALADSPSHLFGISHLRGHETDRLAALATEINGLGGDVTETQDGLRITPRPLHGGDVRTYADHRMATAAAVLGLRVEGLRVEDIDTTAKTLPDFARRWQDMVGSAGRVAPPA